LSEDRVEDGLFHSLGEGDLDTRPEEVDQGKKKKN
jgi:hypothetical protein